MDVTSLLNANSIAAEQQRKMEKGEATKTPTRNRTPWDAGGYSLPINTLSKPTHNTPPQQQNIHFDDSQHTSFSTPTSPHHKFSDSRSSLSSFASSLQSTTHSRFSSTSTTISGTQLSTSFKENLSPVSSLKIHEMDLAHITPLDANQPQPRGSLSPTESLDALALVAEHQMADQQAIPSTPEDKMSTTSEPTPDGPSHTITRPSSPSDAILIKRATLPSLRLITGDQELNEWVQIPPLQRKFLSAPLETYHQSLMHSRGHKRALSAPDFGAFDMSIPTMAMRRAEPTPPSSNHPDIPSPTVATGTTRYPNPDTPPASTDIDAQALVCMYIPDCDTNSQLRKAISHIFGRNKMCTRLVPSHVWVHYCRKHYQRSRYRNPKEYAKLQCDLVQQQIRRIHEWSSDNAEKGVHGTVQDWGLSIRKREQKRLDDLSGSRKRNSTAAFDQDSDEGENGEDASGRPVAVPATAVPKWLLDLCRTGYSTQHILEIFNRLHTEILQDTLPCFPDIEILPNITVDQDEPKSPKGYTRRPTQGHKRAQSLGVGMKSTYQSPIQDRRLSQSAVQGYDGGLYASPNMKRRRQDGMHEAAMSMSPIHNASFQASRYNDHPMESGRRMVQLVHRPAFANIEEHRGSESQYYGPPPTRRQYEPLQAPIPRRPSGQSMAAHLETSNEYTRSRPTHQRSQSDVSNFAHHRYEYSPEQSSAYAPEYVHRSAHYQQTPPQLVYGSPQPRFEPVHYQEMRQQSRLPPPGHGHSRAKSSSMIQSYTSTMPILQENQAQANEPSYFQSSPRSSSRQPSQAHITESEEARAIFSSRR